MLAEIDLDTWPRRSTYEFFKDYADPFFNISANVEVTHLIHFCKQNDLAFSLIVLYCALASANKIPEFRIRLSNGRLVEFDRVEATQTILNDDETFSFCYFEMSNDVFDFHRRGKASLKKYKALRTFDVETERLDLIYFSAIPWISFTSIKHASPLNKHMTVPRIVFGKAFDDGISKRMPLSVEANHAIMDGIHVGKFFSHFQEIADRLEKRS